MKQSPHILSTVILSLYFLTKTLTQNENQKSLPLKEFTVCLSLVLKSQICTSNHHFSLYRGNPNTHTTFKGFPSPLRYNQIAWQDTKPLWYAYFSSFGTQHEICHYLSINNVTVIGVSQESRVLCIPCLFYLEHLFLHLSLAKSHLSRCTSNFIFRRRLFLNTPHSKLTILYFMSPLNSNYILLSMPIILCCNY